jgi:Uma2 family endonuclease
LERRSQITLRPDVTLRPDLALVTAASGKLWLAAEIVSSDDHSADTVVKKQIYEDLKVPRLWMIDPRYDNVEIYHANEFGLILKGILAGQELMTEKLLPEFQLTVAELFRVQPAHG